MEWNKDIILIFTQLPSRDGKRAPETCPGNVRLVISPGKNGHKRLFYIARFLSFLPI